MGKASKGHELSRLTRGGGYSGDTALQSRHALLEHIHGWLHHSISSAKSAEHAADETNIAKPGVDVAKLLESEQSSAMGGVFEHVRL